MYPNFPATPYLAALWFSTFDPSYMHDAYLTLYSFPLGQAGGSPIYSPNENDPPSATRWCPRYAMSGQTQHNVVTSLIWWGQRNGPRPAALMAYAGGQQPF